MSHKLNHKVISLPQRILGDTVWSDRFAMTGIGGITLMGRTVARIASRITTMCKAGGFEEKELYTKAKLLLEIYRDVCWGTAEQAESCENDLYDYSMEYCSGSLESAMLYLETFAPDENRDRFEARINNLFEIKWMIEIIDAALYKVRECPVNGELYISILSAYYLSNFTYTESEMLEFLNIDRSTYYRRKKEAITVFGLSLWGKCLLDYKSIITSEAKDAQISLWELNGSLV